MNKFDGFGKIGLQILLRRVGSWYAKIFDAVFKHEIWLSIFDHGDNVSDMIVF